MRMEDGIELGQALILLLDNLNQGRFRTEERAWRAEDQAWRREDRSWRCEDLTWRDLEKAFMDTQERWRRKDVEQRALDNARVLWDRFVERNRRDVEERAEQLKSIGNIAALISGFAVVAFLEFNADWEEVGVALEAFFGLTTALVVGLNASVMVTSSLMHASILRSGKEYVSQEAESDYLQQCQDFAANFKVGDKPPAPARTFDEHWMTRYERDWRYTFQVFCTGLVAFIANLIVAAWIKFGVAKAYSKLTPSIVTVTLAISMAAMIHSIWSWAPHLFGSKARELQAVAARAARVERAAGLPFDWHRVPFSPDGQRQVDEAFPADDFVDATSFFNAHRSPHAHTGDASSELGSTASEVAVEMAPLMTVQAESSNCSSTLRHGDDRTQMQPSNSVARERCADPKPEQQSVPREWGDVTDPALARVAWHAG